MPIPIRTESSLLAVNCGNHLPRVLARAELEVPDALPGAGRETAVGDGDVDRRTDQR